jgi:GNAT superfamily N-acetyltransferase
VTATIRRPDSADLAALGAFFGGLSLRTRVQRFFAPVRPTPAMVRLACGAASRPGGGGPGGGGPGGGDGPGGGGRTDVLIATHGGVIIGHAMAADRAAAADGLVTEIGVVVADDWQGRGLGAALVRALLGQARARGVTALSMDVLPGNREVLAMIAGHWAGAGTHRSADCLTIEVPLPAGPFVRGKRCDRSGLRARTARVLCPGSVS